MLGKRATEYADIPSEFNDAESAGFLVLLLYCVYEDGIDTFHRLFEIII